MKFNSAATLLPLFSLALAESYYDAVPRAIDADVANVVHYDLVISEGLVNPDGGKERCVHSVPPLVNTLTISCRMAFLLNGKFTGEQFAIDEGDEVEVYSRVFDAVISVLTSRSVRGPQQRQ